MKNVSKLLVIGAVALAVGAVAAVRGGARQPEPGPAAARPVATRAVPRLVDLGAGKCVPCKAMAPILEELKVEYAGRLEVQFIDVWQDPEAARPYGISMIPTQIFFGADGRELGRHEGFIARADILAKWKSLGVAF